MTNLLTRASCLASEHIYFMFDAATPGNVVVVISGAGVFMAAPLAEIIAMARKAKRQHPELMRAIDVVPAMHS